MKRRTPQWLALPAVLFVVLLAGCPGTGNGVPDNDVTVSLWGYPDSVETYFVEIYMLSETDVIEVYAFQDVFTLFPFEQMFAANAEVVAFVFYLSREEDSYEPDWTWFAPYDHTVDEIWVQYWMNYNSLVYYDEISIGISEDLAIPVSPGYAASFDFYDAPYYLLELTDTSGVPSQMEITANGGEVIVRYGDATSRHFMSDFTLQPGETHNEYASWGFTSAGYYLLEPASYDVECSADFALYDVTVSETVETLGQAVQIDFSEHPYQVLRYDSMLNRALEISLDVNGGSIDLKFGTDIADMMRDAVSGYSTDHAEIMGNWESDEMYVLARPDGGAASCSGTLTVSDIPYTAAPGEIKGMVACDGGNTVAAVDYDNRSLLFLDASDGSVIDTIVLPYLRPSALCYAPPPDNRLYIAYLGAGLVTPYDLLTDTLEEAFVYSTTGSAEHIAVEPDALVRKLYVMGSAGFCVIDMDSGALLGTSDAVGFAMAVDGSAEKLYASCLDSINDRYLRRYSITGDVIGAMEEETASAYSSRYVVALSASRTRVVSPLQASYSPDTHTNSLDPLDFTTVVDSWPINCLPNAVAFSPDESYVYFVPGDSDRRQLLVVDVSTDLVIRELPFPYSEGDAIIAPTGNGNHVAGYSQEWMHGDYPRFYFFHDVRE